MPQLFRSVRSGSILFVSFSSKGKPCTYVAYIELIVAVTIFEHESQPLHGPWQATVDRLTKRLRPDRLDVEGCSLGQENVQQTKHKQNIQISSAVVAGLVICFETNLRRLGGTRRSIGSRNVYAQTDLQSRDKKKLAHT